MATEDSTLQRYDCIIAAAPLRGRGAHGTHHGAAGLHLRGEVTEGEGQSCYSCSVLRLVTAMVLLDGVSGEAREGEGHLRSPWVIHPPVTMPGEGPRISAPAAHHMLDGMPVTDLELCTGQQFDDCIPSL